MKKTNNTLLASAILLALSQPALVQADESDKQRIQMLEEKLDALSEYVEQQAVGQQASASNKVHIGGYGEMHYNQLTGEDIEKKGLDFHRMVLFVGYDFNDSMRVVTELELEHVVASASRAGSMILEQAYLEFDLNDKKSMRAKTGIILMPVGIVNEAHEPATFYGVERPIIESTLLPSTWWAGGAMFSQNFQSGISYDVFLSEGLKTLEAAPFDIKRGKQKTTSRAGSGGRADMFNLAWTGRIKYTGTAGLELSAYGQYQPDLDQSAKTSYADSATMLGAHAIYQMGDFTMTGLYTRWDLTGDAAKAAEKNTQTGGYLELSYKPFDKWGFFVRQSEWEKKASEVASQTDFGVNYWPISNVVFKADFQIMNEFAVVDTDWDKIGGQEITTKATGFNLGMGYHF